MVSNRFLAVCFTLFVPLAACGGAGGPESTGSTASALTPTAPQNCEDWGTCGDGLGVYCDAQPGVELGLFPQLLGGPPLATNAPLSTGQYTYLYGPMDATQVCVVGSDGLAELCTPLAAVTPDSTPCTNPGGGSSSSSSSGGFNPGWHGHVAE